jgi:hypothetical protein
MSINAHRSGGKVDETAPPGKTPKYLFIKMKVNPK